ncbi:acyl-CoA N-acyltransferase [Xylaria bambusicola]|uniref:acyl-CoA N-acyltransferase n=1 Tax=Xylaria bambusicola TaxID=326684 RepID=UPI002008A69F|nr:acyl-CoA N-acyltransferase [Xylaria bambusicola]KAI0525793.1 acyl-CoA N-acyltransferase [Xylaria bambusicola]
MNSMLQTDFKLSDVEISDAQDIGHHVEVPAMQNGPLYRTMFPQFNTLIEAQREQITRWYIEMLENAFQAREERFLKVCSVNGTPVGFCGWTVIEQSYDRQQTGEPRKKEREKARKASWLPDTLDIDGWVALSNDLKAERYRVLKDLDNICRLTFMAVHPKYQRQGIGSMMMQRICKETDQQGRCGYVLAAPEGVPLYSKFGFEIVGHVETTHGTITSMFRPSQGPC